MTRAMGLAYGRRPPKGAPALRANRWMTSAVPPHPVSEDYLARLAAWQMLGNDAAGDCVAVTWANVRRILTALLGGHEVYPTLAQVWQVYRTQNPRFNPSGDPSVDGPGSTADGGMDIQTLLEYLHRTGGPDGVKVVAFARVDHTNLEELKAAMAIFGFVWLGINVQAAQLEQFNAGQPWDWVESSPLDGGHSVVAGGYTGQPERDVDFVTWAEETGFTDRYLTRGVEEAWVAIFPEHLDDRQFLEGVDLEALAADYQELTGQVLVIPTPPAPPSPTPTPQPPTPGPTPTPPAPQPDPLVSFLHELGHDLKVAGHQLRVAGEKIHQFLESRNL